MERRKSRRLRANCPVSIISGKRKIEGETEDISATGVMISVDKPLSLYSKCHITFFPPWYKHIALTAQVVRTDIFGIIPNFYTYSMGLCFSEASATSQIQLNNFISKIQSLQGKAGNKWAESELRQ